MEKRVSFRKAAWPDCLFLYHLRNHPETYKYFRNNFPVKFHTHFIWFAKLILGISKKQLMVIEVSGKKAGQLRFDRVNKDCADISISILNDYMKQGVMSYIFPYVAKEFLIENPKVKKLTAHIKFANSPSIRFFEKMGFKRIGKENSEWVYLKMRNEFLGKQVSIL